MCVKGIGQLLHYGNRSLAAIRLRRVLYAVPNRTANVQCLAIKVCPTQAANLALAQSSQRSREHDCTLRFTEERQYPRHFRQAVGVGIFRLWRAWNAHVLNGIDTVENPQSFGLFEHARQKGFDVLERTASKGRLSRNLSEQLLAVNRAETAQCQLAHSGF